MIYQRVPADKLQAAVRGASGCCARWTIATFIPRAPATATSENLRRRSCRRFTFRSNLNPDSTAASGGLLRTLNQGEAPAQCPRTRL